MFDITPQLDCNGRVVRLDRTRVMGIVNVTPDSFSDGGEHATTKRRSRTACDWRRRARTSSTSAASPRGPGPTRSRWRKSCAASIPVIEALVRETSIPISVDTSKPEVMRAAVAAGAGMINDVYALRRDGALDAAASLGVPVVLMHMLGEPRSMQDAPVYDEVVSDVHRFLAERIFAAEMAGIPKSRIVVDPGFGFGKNRDHNLALLARLETHRRTRRAGARGLVAQEDHRRSDRSGRSARSCRRLGRRAPDRRAAGRKAGAGARRGTDGGCVEGLGRHRRATGGAGAGSQARDPVARRGLGSDDPGVSLIRRKFAL